VAISKLFFFPSWKCGDLVFFGNFPKCSLHHVCFHGGLFNGFSSQKINKIKIKVVALRLCVCLSWFKETGGFHNARRSRVPTIYNILGVCPSDRPPINAFQKKKAWILPKSSTNLSDFKTCFSFSSKCGDFKTFFFPPSGNVAI
jgi:hypothetical protein